MRNEIRTSLAFYGKKLYFCELLCRSRLYGQDY